MELRERVFSVWKASGDADDVAATFGVSRAWLHRLAQRYRQTRHGKNQIPAPDVGGPESAVESARRADTRCDVGRAPRAVAHDGRTQHPVVQLDRLALTVKTVHATERHALM
jgi:hypothetical protein